MNVIPKPLPLFVLLLLPLSLVIAADADAYEDPSKPHRVRLRETAVAQYESQGPAAAEAALDTYLAEMQNQGMKKRRVYGAVWREAQLHAGARDAGLAEVFYRWILRRSTQGDLSGSTSPNSGLVLVGNLIGACNRQGKVAESSRWSAFAGRLLAHAGIDVDPQRYEDTGPYYEWLPTARQRTYPLRRKDQPLKNSSSDRYLSHSQMSGILMIARQAWREGDWQRALELASWVRQLGDVQRNNPFNYSDFTQTHIWWVHHNANALIGEIIWEMGGEKDALDVVSESLELPGGAYWSWHWDHYRNLTWRAKRGEQFPQDTLEGLENILPKMIENKYASDALVFKNRRTQIWLQVAQGDYASALRDLADLESGKYADRIPTMELRLHLALREARTAPELEDTFIRLLEKYREHGQKVYEPRLYTWYARYLANCGRFEEAVLMQTEAVRLYRSLDMGIREVEGKAFLSEYLVRSNQTTAAAPYLQELDRTLQDPQTLLPPSITSRIQKTLSTIPDPTSPFVITQNDPRAKSDLQPKLVVTQGLPGRSAHGRFTLANLTEQDQTGVLTITGPDPRVHVIGENQDMHVLLDLSKPEKEVRLDIRLKPEELVPIHLQTSIVVPEMEKAVTLDWKDQSATWELTSGMDSDDVVITEANLISSNPYYLVPIFHTLQHPGTTASDISDFRLISSSAGRIEVYENSGALLYIDANGDGDLEDEGDVLASDLNGNQLPDIRFKDISQPALLEAYYQASSSVPSQDHDITIELHQDGHWVPYAVDKLVTDQR